MLVERLGIKWESGSQRDRSVFVRTVVSNSKAWPFLATSLPIHPLSTSYNSTLYQGMHSKKMSLNSRSQKPKSLLRFSTGLWQQFIHCTIISSQCPLSVRDVPKTRPISAVNSTAVFRSSPYTTQAINHKFKEMHIFTNKTLISRCYGTVLLQKKSICLNFRLSWSVA